MHSRRKAWRPSLSDRVWAVSGMEPGSGTSQTEERKLVGAASGRAGAPPQRCKMPDHQSDLVGLECVSMTLDRARSCRTVPQHGHSHEGGQGFT